MKTKIFETTSMIEKFTIRNNALCFYKNNLLRYKSNSLLLPSKLVDIITYNDLFVLILYCGDILFLDESLVIVKTISIDDFIYDFKFSSAINTNKGCWKAEDKIKNKGFTSRKCDPIEPVKNNGKICDYDKCAKECLHTLEFERKANSSSEQFFDRDYLLGNVNSEEKTRPIGLSDNILSSKPYEKIIEKCDHTVYILGLIFLTELNILSEETKKIKNRGFIKFCKGDKFYFGNNNGDIFCNNKRLYSHYAPIQRMEINRYLYTLCTEKLIIYDCKNAFIAGIVSNCVGLGENLYYTKTMLFLNGQQVDIDESFLEIKIIDGRIFGLNMSCVFEILV